MAVTWARVGPGFERRGAGFERCGVAIDTEWFHWLLVSDHVGAPDHGDAICLCWGAGGGGREGERVSVREDDCRREREREMDTREMVFWGNYAFKDVGEAVSCSWVCLPYGVGGAVPPGMGETWIIGDAVCATTA